MPVRRQGKFFGFLLLLVGGVIFRRHLHGVQLPAGVPDTFFVLRRPVRVNVPVPVGINELMPFLSAA